MLAHYSLLITNPYSLNSQFFINSYYKFISSYVGFAESIINLYNKYYLFNLYILF